jgi:hypothetical protein
MELGRQLIHRFQQRQERREREEHIQRNREMDYAEARHRVARANLPRALGHALEATFQAILPFAVLSMTLGAVRDPPLSVESYPIYSTGIYLRRQTGTGYTLYERSNIENTLITLFNLISLFTIPRAIQNRFDDLQQEGGFGVEVAIQRFRQWAERNRIRPAPVENIQDLVAEPIPAEEMEELQELNMLPVPSPTDLLSGAARPYFASETEESLPAPLSVPRDEPPTSVGMYASQPRREAVAENVEEL